MLLCNRLSSLKHSAMVSIISATVFLAGTALPDFDVMAEEAQQSAAPAESTSADAPALLTADQLVELVGPVALYPDELLAITLPAATYPLDIVQAARFLEKHKSNPDLKPDEKWDESVLGLLNYPEVIDLMNRPCLVTNIQYLPVFPIITKLVHCLCLLCCCLAILTTGNGVAPNQLFFVLPPEDIQQGIYIVFPQCSNEGIYCRIRCFESLLFWGFGFRGLCGGIGPGDNWDNTLQWTA